MRSVADDLRAETLRRLATLSASERLDLAFTLGDADVAALCATRGIGRAEAIATFRRSRQTGRPTSRCHDR